MADLFAGEDQPIYMSEADNKLAGKFATGEARKISTERFLKEGFPGDILELVYSTNPARTEAMPSGDLRMSELQDAQKTKVGEYELETILVPGHTPGNCMFWEASQKSCLPEITCSLILRPTSPTGPGARILWDFIWRACARQGKIRTRNWQEFPAIQKWFAVGECISHLDYLLKRGHITKYESGGFTRYKII